MLGVFFGADAISYSIPSFLLPKTYWKAFIFFHDVCGVSFLPSQCSRAHGLLYFTLHAPNWAPIAWLTECCFLTCVLPRKGSLV